MENDKKIFFEDILYDSIYSEDNLKDLRNFERKIVQCWSIIHQLPDELFNREGYSWSDHKELMREMANSLESYYLPKMIDRVVENLIGAQVPAEDRDE